MQEELRTMLVELIAKAEKSQATVNHEAISADKLFADFSQRSTENDEITVLKRVLNKRLYKGDEKICLRYAIKNRNILLLRYLIENFKEAGIQFTRSDIEAVLCEVIQNNDAELFTHLIEAMNIADDINKPLTTLYGGCTLVCLALSAGAKEIVESLIRMGADLKISDFFGNTALAHAISSENIDCLRIVLPIITKEELFETNMHGLTPLHVAVRAYLSTGHSEILDELCAKFDLNKDKLLNDFKDYPVRNIRQHNLIGKISRLINVDDAQTKAEIAGLCHGLSFVFGLNAVRSREDMMGFYQAVELLAAWDGRKESLDTPTTVTYMRNSYSTLGGLLQQFCNDVLYFYAQGLSVIDIPPHDRKTQYNVIHDGGRHISPILNISMNKMQQNEFVELLRETLKPNTILDITSANHVISVVCNDKNEIYYYDSNNYFPTVKPISHLENLSVLIYNTMPSIPKYIGVYHISDRKMVDIEKEYPTAVEIVNRYILSTDRKYELTDELVLCAVQDSPEIFELLLKSDQFPTLSPQLRGDLINVALEDKKSLRCLNVLIKYGNLNQDEIDIIKNSTVMKNYNEILKTLKAQKTQSPQHTKLFK